MESYSSKTLLKLFLKESYLLMLWIILRNVYRYVNWTKVSFNSVSFWLCLVGRLVVQKRCEDADNVTRSSLILRAFIRETEHGKIQKLSDWVSIDTFLNCYAHQLWQELRIFRLIKPFPAWTPLQGTEFSYRASKNDLSDCNLECHLVGYLS